MIERISLTLLWVIVIGNQLGFGQHNSYLQDVIPPTPEMASLGRYGEIPVGSATGVPSISIPLVNLSEGELSHQVVLSYHSGGIRVSEISSWVGLGWTLMAGGSITRMVRNSEDEGNTGKETAFGTIYQGGYYENSGLWPDLSTLDFLSDNDHFVDISRGLIDTEADVYHYNFGTYSGRFYIDVNQKIRHFADHDLKIEVEYNSTTKQFEWWMITDDQGNQYYFGENDAVEISNSYSSLYEGCSGPNDPNCLTSDVTTYAGYASYNDQISAWYLTKIVSANGYDEITFEYVDDYYKYRHNGSESRYLYEGLCPNPITFSQSSVAITPELNQIVTELKGKRLSAISTANFEIAFNSVSDRVDLEYYDRGGIQSLGRRLSSIEFTRKRPPAQGGDELIKTISFDNDTYFDATGSGDQNLDQSHITDYKRLRLDQLEIFGNPQTESNEYQFEYYEDLQSLSLPRRLSMRQDLWGYFNGSGYETTLLPTFSWDGGSTCTLNNRQVNENLAKAYSLKSITYPTGGWTEFIYESNERAEKGEKVEDVSNIGCVQSDCNTSPQCNSSSSWILGTDLDVIDQNQGNSAQVYVTLYGIYVPTYLPGSGSGGSSGNCEATISFRLNGSLLNTMVVAAGEGETVANFDFVGTVGQTIEIEVEGAGIAHAQIWGNTFSWIPSKVGGLRVSEIKNYHHDGTLQTVKSYEYPDIFTFENGAEYSNGYLVGYPFNLITLRNPLGAGYAYASKYEETDFEYNISIFGIKLLTLNLSATIGQSTALTLSHMISSQGMFSMPTSFGSHIIYRKVIEKESGNGYRELYHFALESDVGELYQAIGYPIPPEPYNFDSRVGKLSKEKTYSETGQLLIEKHYEYHEVEAPFLLKGAQSRIRINPHPDNLSDKGYLEPVEPGVLPVAVGEYYLRPNFSVLEEVQTVTIGANGGQFVSTVEFEHDGLPEFVQVSKETVVESGGLERTTSFVFPYDLEIPTGGTTTHDETIAIQEMIAQNVISVPVEKIESFMEGGQSKTTEATHFEYVALPAINGGEMVKLKSMWLSEFATPVSDYELPSLSQSGSNYEAEKDSRLSERVNFDYYPSGRLLSQNLTEGTLSSYSYYDGLPRLIIQNAEEGEFAYSSFETAEASTDGNWSINGVSNGNWESVSFSGLQALRLPTSASNIQFTVAQAGDYSISMWYQGSPKITIGSTVETPVNQPDWTYWSKSYSGISQGTVIKVEKGASAPLVDELRFHPSDAQMTTYCYDDALRVQTVIDVNGRCLYYEYDALGRLRLVRDHRDNILKRIQYEYGDF